jgi:flagellar biosynthetic protein FlhB
MSGEDDDDKQHDPSQKRLDDARKRGEVVKSVDLTTAAAYAGLLLVGLVAGGSILRHFGQTAMVLLDQADRLAPLVLRQGTAPVGGIAISFGATIAPVFLAPMAAVLLALLGQRALLFAPDKLEFKWSRLSPLTAAKQKFGREGLFEFGKSFAKMVVFASILGMHLVNNASQILGSLALTPALGIAIMLKLLLEFLFLVVLTVAAFGALDYMWQRAQHIRRNRMSRQEMVDEAKDSEGDPHVKMQRRQRGHDIATNQMLQAVAKADVIVVNPTHYAVALKWNRKSRGAPICVAKGMDELAARIREKAAEAGVPIHSDPPTARAIHATVEVGQTILPQHYRSVAAAIRFSEAMRKRRKVFVK